MIDFKFSDIFVKERKMSREITYFLSSVNECYFALDLTNIEALWLTKEPGNFECTYFG